MLVLTTQITEEASYFVNQLYNDQLENVPECVNLVNTRAQVIQSSLLLDVKCAMKPWEENSHTCMCADGEDSTHLICMNQHHEGISLAACIFLIHQKIMDQLWSVGDEVVKVPNPNK